MDITYTKQGIYTILGKSCKDTPSIRRIFVKVAAYVCDFDLL